VAGSARERGSIPAALLAAARAPERVAAVLAIVPAVRSAEPPPDFDVAHAGAVADEHGYIELRGPGSSGDNGEPLRAQLENVRCPVVVAIPRNASSLQM
jgi:hypothetical protein